MQPAAVQLIGASFLQGKLGILMELMSQDLHTALASNAIVWGPVGLRIAQDIASGLAYIHRVGVIHLDSKSYNCLVGLVRLPQT